MITTGSLVTRMGSSFARALRTSPTRWLRDAAIEILGGTLPRRQQRLVEAWAELHQGELLETWDRLQSGPIPFRIAPLR